MIDREINQKAWWMVLPVVALVAFNALIPLMTVVNYSFQETFGDNLFFWEGRAGICKSCSRNVFTPRFTAS